MLQSMTDPANFTANYAKELLEENVKLTEQHRVEMEAFRSQIETLLQEKHILKGKYEAKLQLEADYQADIDALKTNCNEKISALKKNFNAKLTTLEEQNARLTSELEETVRTEEVSTLKITQFEAEINSLRGQISVLNSASTLNVSVNRTRSDSDELLEENDRLKVELEKLSGAEIHLQNALRDCQNRLDDSNQLTTELREENRQLKRDFESCNDSLIEANAELNILKATPAEEMSSKGNSLFAEVNDHRLKLEAQLITLKVQNDRYKEENIVNADKIRDLKMQIGSLLQMGSTGSHNSSRLTDTLTAALDNAKREISALKSRLDRAERQKNVELPSQRLSDPNGSKATTCWSDAIISQLRDDRDKLQSQLDAQKFERFAIEEELVVAERKLAQSERQKDDLTAANYRLSVQLEDTKSRATPSTAKKSACLVEKLPLESSSSGKLVGVEKENFFVTQAYPIGPDVKKKGVKMAESLTVYSADGDSADKRLSQVGINRQSDCLTEEKSNRPKGRKVMTSVVDITTEDADRVLQLW